MKASSRELRLWVVVLSVCGAVTGCGKKGGGGEDNGALALHGDCSGASLGCAGTVLVRCTDGIWQGQQDCSGRGLNCGKTSDGVYDCLSSAAGGCDINGQGAGGAAGTGLIQVTHWDDDVFGIYSVLSLEVDGADDLTSQIFLMVAPDLVVGREYSFSGANSKPETALEVAMTAMTADGKQYAANVGSIVFSSLPGLGETLRAEISGASMRQVTRSEQTGTVDVPSGGTWCLDSFFIEATVIRYTCDWIDLGVGGQVMTIGQSICGDTYRVACRQSTVFPDIEGLDEVYLAENCADTGLQCVDSDPLNAATCQ